MEGRTRHLFEEIIAENFLNLGKDLDIKVNKANRLAYYHNEKDLLQDT